MALTRNGMERLWKSSKGKKVSALKSILFFCPFPLPQVPNIVPILYPLWMFPSFVLLSFLFSFLGFLEFGWLTSRMILIAVSSLYELCAHAIVNRTTVYGIDRLPVPPSIRQSLKSYSLTSYSTLRRPNGCGGGSGVISAVTNSYNKQSSQKSRRNNTFRETSKISNLSFKFKTRRGGQTSGSASSSANTASSRETKKAICVLSWQKGNFKFSDKHLYLIFSKEIYINYGKTLENFYLIKWNL